MSSRAAAGVGVTCMKIAIGCDHGGFELKAVIIEHLNRQGKEIADFGAYDCASCDYPDYAVPVCEAVLCGEADFGILICGTGIGMCITANKCKGIRAVVAHDIYSARRSILSNDCNVLCLGARVIGVELAKSILTEWVSLEFADGASTPKVNEMKKVEAKHFRD